MRLPEQRVWDTMKRQLGQRPGLWLERIENVVADGQPDVRACTFRRIKEVELKAAVLPKRAGTRVLGDKGLRVSQISWHRKAAYYGLPVYTLIRDDKGELYLIHCKHAEKVNDATQEQLREMRCASTWDEVYKELVNGEN